MNQYFAFFNQELISKNLFSQIRCPVLLIADERDTHAPLDTMINAYKMILNAQLAIIPKAPHQVFITDFDPVWIHVEKFLKA